MDVDLIIANDVSSETSKLTEALETLIFESVEAAEIKATINLTKLRLTELTNKFNIIDKADNSRKMEATRLTKRLLKEGVSFDTIVTVLKQEYPNKCKQTAINTDRKIQKISIEDQNVIQQFINENSGLTTNQIFEKFPNLNKPGISIFLKRLVGCVAVRAEGNTRARKYFPIT
ncbi:MAG: hypothetical protein ACOYLO_00485 [Ferruginibacter sp.]